MSKEIIINVTGEHSRIAIVEDGELVELYIENPENVRTIGDIYLGRIRRILPGIKAAFVDIGQKQDAFLHFSDLSDNLPDLLELSDGKVADHLKKHLAKAPKQPEDGSDSGLELETPQEQRAARRRRDLKRTQGRRGRKQTDAQQQEPKAEGQEPRAEAQAEQPEAKKPEARKAAKKAETKRSEARAPRAARGAKKQDAPEQDASETDTRATTSRRRAAAPPQPPISDEVPAPPPPILPPDAVEPLQPEGAEAGKEEPADQPPKRKRRRGGRGRGRNRAANPQAEAGPQDPPEPKAERPESHADEERDEAAEARSKRSRSSRRKKAEAPQDASAPSDEETAEARVGDEARADKPERPARQRAPQARRRKAERPDAEKAEVATEKTEPRPVKKAEPERPARSSRFVIDLTSKSGRLDPDDREEEEEEEEKKSSRSRRSSSRRRGGRRRSGSGRGGRRSDEGSDDKGEDRSDERSRSGGSRSGRRSGGRGGSRSNGNGSSGPRPETYLKQDQKLIVKITKEPISSKGPRVSTDVSLAGRFLVLIPLADYVAVSKKIESAKERRRLRALARSLLPEGFGLIVRTVAENRDAKALDTDLRLLLQKWHKIEDQLRKKPTPPAALYEDVNMVSSIIRDLFSEDYDRIVVDDPKVHRNVKNYVQAVAPQMADKVALHKGKDHVFRTYKIDGEVRAAFETRVPLPGGGYLFIEHTEAMHVVDVNSGRAGRGLSQEENALRVNLESARMIAKQLRLRDLGGIIVVDFIDMRSDSARKKVYDELKKEFRKDRAVTKLLPMSDFGVVQITRQRLRPSITTTTNVDDLPQAEEPAAVEPAAAESVVAERSEPTGPQPTAAEVVGTLERWLLTYRDEVQDQHRKRPILVKLHPFLAAYLQRGIPSTLTRWKFKTRLNFRLDVDEHADPLSFSVRDEKSGKNLTKKYDPDERTADAA